MIKKILIIAALMMVSIFLNQPQSSQKITVEYDNTVDGDTLYLIEEGTRQKYRLLMVDTPEMNEIYGKDAKEYTKLLIENGTVIEIEYQNDNEITDLYGRKLVWVFIDGQLLQVELAKAGYVEDLYDNGGKYTYKNEVNEAMQYAREHHVGLYSEK